MKKFILFFLTVIFAISFLQAGTIANVIGHKDLLLTIDRGTLDGVDSGMKGIVKAVYKEPSGEYTINIGIFTVKKMADRSAEVLIEIGKGLNPDDARYVVFDQDLISAEPKPEPEPEPKPKVLFRQNQSKMPISIWSRVTGKLKRETPRSLWNIIKRLWPWHQKAWWPKKNAMKCRSRLTLLNGKKNS